jgi:hypothetical protein
MGDVLDRRARQALRVIITIRVEGDRELPEGHVAVDEAPPIPFAGWLQLLGVLSCALPEGAASLGLAKGLSGQLHPRADPELGEDVGHVGVDRVP